MATEGRIREEGGESSTPMEEGRRFKCRLPSLGPSDMPPTLHHSAQGEGGGAELARPRQHCSPAHGPRWPRWRAPDFAPERRGAGARRKGGRAGSLIRGRGARPPQTGRRRRYGRRAHRGGGVAARRCRRERRMGRSSSRPWIRCGRGHSPWPSERIEAQEGGLNWNFFKFLPSP